MNKQNSRKNNKESKAAVNQMQVMLRQRAAQQMAGVVTTMKNVEKVVGKIETTTATINTTTTATHVQVGEIADILKSGFSNQIEKDEEIKGLKRKVKQSAQKASKQASEYASLLNVNLELKSKLNHVAQTSGRQQSISRSSSSQRNRSAQPAMSKRGTESCKRHPNIHGEDARAKKRRKKSSK